MKIVMTQEVCGRKETTTIAAAKDAVRHTTGWVAIEYTSGKIRWFNQSKVVDFTVEEESSDTGENQGAEKPVPRITQR